MKRWKVIVLVVSFLWVLVPFFVWAEMTPLGDNDLSNVVAAAGVWIEIKDVTYDEKIAGVEYTDTDTGNSIEFNNFKAHDGADNPVYFDSGDGTTPIEMNIFTVDDPLNPIDGKTVFSWVNDEWTQLLAFEVENFVFVDQDLGVLEIGNIDMPNSHIYTSPVGGIGLEFGLQMNIERIKWTYNTAPTSIAWSGVNLAKSATGDPTDPSSWVFSGKFLMGDLYGNGFYPGSPSNPAEFRIGTVGPSTHQIIDLPMDGCVRIEDLDFAGQDFGPMAIDGITVHRLQIQVPAI